MANPLNLGAFTGRGASGVFLDQRDGVDTIPEIKPGQAESHKGLISELDGGRIWIFDDFIDDDIGIALQDHNPGGFDDASVDQRSSWVKLQTADEDLLIGVSSLLGVAGVASYEQAYTSDSARRLPMRITVDGVVDTSADNDFGCVFRVLDDLNFWKTVLIGDTGVVSIIRVVGGTPQAAEATDTFSALSDGDLLRQTVSVKPDSVTAVIEAQFVQELTVSGGSTATGTATVTVNGVDFVVNLPGTSSTTDDAAAIAALIVPGWTLTDLGGSVVEFKANAVGDKTGTFAYATATAGAAAAFAGSPVNEGVLTLDAGLTNVAFLDTENVNGPLMVTDGLVEVWTMTITGGDSSADTVITTINGTAIETILSGSEANGVVAGLIQADLDGFIAGFTVTVATNVITFTSDVAGDVPFVNAFDPASSGMSAAFAQTDFASVQKIETYKAQEL